ncbi:MAG: type II toxin-antitoxin system RelE/ParE family toxin [Gammaproteobacteria bacterium]|nr:type II toxin-antitoxin system RelE/ParE family toxin [Gammaproteobacteria bacterium]
MKDKELLQQVRTIIEQIELADSLHGVKHLRPLEGTSRYYRIRVRDYRVGIIMEQGTVTFVRCLHRKEIYRYFP